MMYLIKKLETYMHYIYEMIQYDVVPNQSLSVSIKIIFDRLNFSQILCSLIIHSCMLMFKKLHHRIVFINYRELHNLIYVKVKFGNINKVNNYVNLLDL